jgi:DNA modification methylase
VESEFMKKTSGVVLEKKRLNDLDGKTWTRYSISIWNVVKSCAENKLRHPAMFPSELCKRLIEIYTKKGDLVLDPFLGSGSTLAAARDLARRGVGLEINAEFVKLARSRLSQEKLIKLDVPEPETFCDDAINLSKYVKDETVDLCITSPPYWNIHLRKRSADYKESRPYSELDRDIGNIPEYSTFMTELSKIFTKVYKALKHGKRCVVIVMDIRVQSKFIPFHVDVIKMMEGVGYILEDIIIWDRKAEYSNLRPLGYPYAFIVNKIHEYILIFRKNKEEEIDLNGAKDRLS